MLRLKHLLLVLFITLSGSFVLVPALASADFKTDACSGVNAVGGTAGSSCSTTGGVTISRIIKVVLNLLSIVVGFAAVVMIVLGGFKYITSNGDSSNIASARSTILYAVVGLVIVALSQVLVHFVIANSNAAINNCTTVTCKAKNK